MTMPESKAVRLHAARIFKALSHPARIWILEDLARSGERCVCELARLMEADDSTVSRHLTQLRVAGLVANERRGAQVYCRLSTPEVMRLVEAAKAVAGRGGARAGRQARTSLIAR